MYDARSESSLDQHAGAFDPVFAVPGFKMRPGESSSIKISKVGYVNANQKQRKPPQEALVVKATTRPVGEAAQ